MNHPGAVPCRQANRSAAVIMLLACLPTMASAAQAPIGFASLNGGTTGGGNGPTVIATTAGQFTSFAEQDGPLVIKVNGNFNVGQLDVASDKTIIGVGPNAGLVGNIRLHDVSNVIIQNLSISNPSGIGSGDGLELREATNIWIDHSNIFDTRDGLFDIVSESDFVTVSWNKFYYTDDYAQNVNTGHRFAMLIGNSDGATEDADNLRVTLHHNHWGANIRERMPRVRYGEVHAFNNYFNSPGNNYGIRAAFASEVLVENNSFENFDDPYIKMNDAQPPLIEASGNVFVNTTGGIDDGNDDVFEPTYAYTLEDAMDVKASVLAGAGVGFVPLAGDYNEDGTVDAADYTVWRDNLGQPAGTLSNDPDGGAIGLNQYNSWRNNFGTVEGSGSGTLSPVGVPEPASLLLFVTAASLLIPAARHYR